MIWCYVCYVLSTFHLPAKFRFASLNAVLSWCPATILQPQTSHPAEQSWKERRFSVAGLAKIQGCVASDLPFHLVIKRADGIANETAWEIHTLASLHPVSTALCLRPLISFIVTWPCGPPILYTLHSQNRQYIIIISLMWELAFVFSLFFCFALFFLFVFLFPFGFLNQGLTIQVQAGLELSM